LVNPRPSARLLPVDILFFITNLLIANTNRSGVKYS
jgi:hypothetical protein